MNCGNEVSTTCVSGWINHSSGNEVSTTRVSGWINHSSSNEVSTTRVSRWIKPFNSTINNWPLKRSGEGKSFRRSLS